MIRAGERIADEVEVYLAEGRSVSAELQRDRIDRAEESRSWGMAIRIITNGRIGISSTGDPVAWERCLQAAVDSAYLATPQEWKGLPGPSPLGGKAPCFDFLGPGAAYLPFLGLRLLSGEGAGSVTWSQTCTVFAPGAAVGVVGGVDGAVIRIDGWVRTGSSMVLVTVAGAATAALTVG